MTKLEDVETHLTKTDHDTWFILYAELMTRAVRQLGAERAVYQKLFEATDNVYLQMADEQPEIDAALKDISATAEPDLDVLELLS